MTTVPILGFHIGEALGYLPFHAHCHTIDISFTTELQKGCILTRLMYSYNYYSFVMSSLDSYK